MFHLARTTVIALCLFLTCAGARAQSSVALSDGGTLQSSVGVLGTDAGAVTNNLTLLTSGTTGFNFSGTTGSNTALSKTGLGGASSNGYYYTDYLINVAPGTAESVTTALANSSGVSNLSERIYQTSSPGSLLGDAAPGGGALQVWSTNYPLAGTQVSIVAPTLLSAAGLYVVEIRGTSAGNFGGTLSITAVPEAGTFGLMLAGLALVAVAVGRRRAN